MVDILCLWSCWNYFIPKLCGHLSIIHSMQKTNGKCIRPEVRCSNLSSIAVKPVVSGWVTSFCTACDTSAKRDSNSVSRLCCEDTWDHIYASFINSEEDRPVIVASHINTNDLSIRLRLLILEKKKENVEKWQISVNSKLWIKWDHHLPGHC